MKKHLVGHIQRPGEKPQNVEIVVDQRANITSAERAAGIQWVDSDYEPGNVLRYGAVGDGVTDDTVAIQAAVDVLELGPGGIVRLPIGTYRVTSPIVNDSDGVSFVGNGAANRGQANRTAIYLDSSTASDYAIKLSSTSFITAGHHIISGIEFIGTNNANNQGGVLIAGRASYLSIEKCSFSDFTGYAIGRDPSVASYTQNNSIRDVGFYNVGGCYGLISEPASSANYLAETLLTIDNVNLDQTLNATDVKPYIWDFRASRNVNAGIILVEGAGVSGVTAVFGFATNGAHRIDQMWVELTGTNPTYSIDVIADSTGKFYQNQATDIRVGWANFTQSVHFESEAVSMEATVFIQDWFYYTAASATDVVVFDGAQGRLEVERIQVKVPFIIPESLYGRLIIGQYGGDNEVSATLTQRAMSLFNWNSGMGAIEDASTGYVNATINVSQTPTVEYVADGNFRVLKMTGNATTTPLLIFTFTTPTSWIGAMITFAIRYRSVFDAGDVSGGTTFKVNYTDNLDFDDFSIIGGTTANGADYETAYVTARLGTALTQQIFTRNLGTTPTVAPIVFIESVQAWLGQPETFNIAAPQDDLGLPTGRTPTSTFTSTDATPSVAGGKVFKTAGTTTITDFDGGLLGQTITILADASITITDNAAIILNGSGNYAMTASDTLTLTMFDDQVWQEVSRSVN